MLRRLCSQKFFRELTTALLPFQGMTPVHAAFAVVEKVTSLSLSI